MGVGYKNFILNVVDIDDSKDCKVTVDGVTVDDGAGGVKNVEWGDARIDYGNGEGINLTPGSYKFQAGPAPLFLEDAGSAIIGVWEVYVPKDATTLVIEGATNFEAVTIDFTDFDKLEILHLINCGLTTMPDLSPLINLKSLNLKNNNMIGAFPNAAVEFANNPLLQSVVLDGNSFTGDIPNLDALPDLTTYSYIYNDLIQNLAIQVIDVDWDFITTSWEEVPGRTEVFNLYGSINLGSNNLLYSGNNTDYVHSGLASGDFVQYTVENSYFSHIIDGVAGATTDTCTTPTPNELSLIQNLYDCESIRVTWSNNWRDSPNRSDLTMSLELLLASDDSVIEGPVDVKNATDRSYSGLTTNTEYKSRMTITKCGSVQVYDKLVNTDDCTPTAVSLTLDSKDWNYSKVKWN